MERNEYGTNLRRIRYDRNISQETMATNLNISQTMYSRIERGLFEPDDLLRARIAVELGMTNEAIYSYSAKVPPTGRRPSDEFDYRAKEIFNTPVGVILFMGAAITIINVLDESVRGFCAGYGASVTVTRVSSVIVCGSMLIYVVRLFLKFRKI